MELPDIKLTPKYGYYPRWPEDGDAWVHPEDAALAKALLPSPRVFRRDGEFARVWSMAVAVARERRDLRRKVAARLGRVEAWFAVDTWGERKVTRAPLHRDDYRRKTKALGAG